MSEDDITPWGLGNWHGLSTAIGRVDFALRDAIEKDEPEQRSGDKVDNIVAAAEMLTDAMYPSDGYPIVAKDEVVDLRNSLVDLIQSYRANEILLEVSEHEATTRECRLEEELKAYKEDWAKLHKEVQELRAAKQAPIKQESTTFKPFAYLSQSADYLQVFLKGRASNSHRVHGCGSLSYDIEDPTSITGFAVPIQLIVDWLKKEGSFDGKI